LSRDLLTLSRLREREGPAARRWEGEGDADPKLSAIMAG